MSQLNQARERISASTSAFWQARTGQERTFLSVGGAVLGLALVYALAIGPALGGRERLQRELPELRLQAAELKALAMQASQLSAVAPVAAPPMTRESVTASLKTHSLTAQTVSVTGEFLRLQLSGVPFPALMAWLDAQRRDARINVQEATITAQNTAGQVDATLTLLHGSGGAR
ncbi:type II secretion system protein M [Oxalobacteraceae bacterium]|nr:type II secretion system protein M [Oxalobacteraceae bacterium]